MIGFEEVDLFLEGLSSLEGELVYLSGDIEITRNEAGGYNYYTAVGYGIFSISGLEFNYSGKGLACDGATLDLSKGGLVVRADASIDSVYTLPLLAK